MKQDSYIALMRGINVGGKNKLPMKDLKVIFEDIGCDSVETYIQSGNVVFHAKKSIVKRLLKAIPLEIETRHSLTVPVIIRSAEELVVVARDNPFLNDTQGTIDTKTLHVGFLRDRPSDEKIVSLDADRSPPDQFQLKKRELYLFCPNGLGRSKLTTGYFDRTLKTVTTVRNWNTVMKLLSMVGGEE